MDRPISIFSLNWGVYWRGEETGKRKTSSSNELQPVVRPPAGAPRKGETGSSGRKRREN